MQGNQKKSVEPDPELDELAHQVVSAAREVHRALGPGLEESAYGQAMGLELSARGIPFARHVPVSLDYKGHTVGHARVDLLVGGRLVVLLRAQEAIAPAHPFQVLFCLRATGHPLGLLINFCVAELRHGVRRVTLRAPLEN